MTCPHLGEAPGGGVRLLTVDADIETATVESNTGRSRARGSQQRQVLADNSLRMDLDRIRTCEECIFEAPSVSRVPACLGWCIANQCSVRIE